MIRELENMEKVQLTVETIDGELYEKRDTTEFPFGQYERVVEFWDGDIVVRLPMRRVKSILMHF